MEQDLETNSSSEDYSTPEPDTKRENGYGSPNGLEATIRAAETKRVDNFAEESRSAKSNKKVPVRKDNKRSKLPIVDLHAFSEYKELLRKYSDRALASQYEPYGTETGFLVDSCRNITGKDIERVCELAQEKIQNDYKHLMCSMNWDGIPLLSKLVYFRLTPAKKVFLTFNIPQLKAVAFKKVAAEGLVANTIDFEEKFIQFYLYDELQDSLKDYRLVVAIETKYEQVRSDILSLLQSQEFEIDAGTVRFKEAIDTDDFAILRIIQPHNQMEDILGPLLWSLKSEGVKVLAKTPIFNEGFTYVGDEYHSALALVSISKTSEALSPPFSYAFQATEIDVLARSSNCQACVEEDNTYICSHCKYCIEKGVVKKYIRRGSCPHGKKYSNDR